MHFIYAHLIGDYIFQNDKMAANKKVSDLWCTYHVATYMLPFLLCGLLWWQFVLIALQHWIQDRTGFVRWFMLKTGKEETGFLAAPMAPWSLIVTDNVLHILWMGFVMWLGQFAYGMDDTISYLNKYLQQIFNYIF